MTETPTKLNRSMTLVQATAINMIDMVGIGPFVTMPLVIGLMGNSYFIFAWIFGAFVSIIDAMVWAELGAAYPMAGGSYHFLKAAYKDYGILGRLMPFLYIWQTSIQAPLVVASGAIGFSQYFSYLVNISVLEQKLLSAIIVILLIVLLYRKIETVGKIGVALWVVVLVTIGAIIFGGLTNGTTYYSPLPAGDFSFLFQGVFWMALGQASVKTIYSYLGYYNVCHLGGEIKNPQKNIPRSIFISVFGIAILYLLMNYSIVQVIPYQLAAKSQFLVSEFIEILYGKTAGIIVTVCVLFIAFASLFAVILGYSRVPYAAAVDGNFFSVFAKLHPTKNFPHISLLVMGFIALIFSLLFKLTDVISAILAMRILVQFIGQAIGIVLLRKRNGTRHLPFKMWLYPVPVIAAISTWLFILFSTGWRFAISGLIIILIGTLVFFALKNKLGKPHSSTFKS
jgi:fructoselysine transporter